MNESKNTHPSRRQFLTTGSYLAGGVLAAGSLTSAATPSPRPQDDDSVDPDADFLFVQTAASAVLADGKLTLRGVSPTTIYFSDRPERVAGHVETEHFIAAMIENEDPNSFSENPPNAELSILDGDYVDEVVVTLHEPELRGDELIYPIEVLDGLEDLEGGPATLFIDPIGRPASPGSVAGVHRRRRRRHRRRVTHRW